MNLKKVLSLLLALVLVISSLCSCSIKFADIDSANVISNENPLRVHFLDVGQGDSLFIEMPNDETMLIDTGENYHGEGIIDYINDCGYSKIDYLVGTHPHSDHIGSMGYIVRNYNIGNIYMPKVSANTKTYENLLTSISDKGLKVKTAKAGVNIVSNDDLTVDIIAPVTIDNDNLNNSSVVIKLIYKDTSYLFTGDAEKEEIASMQADVSADVLKVGHHGSKTSTTNAFLKEVNPQIAVISCGEDNEYGHPHKSTLNYLEKNHCEIYRTDVDKTVIISSDGTDYSIQTDVNSIERVR